MIYKYLCPNQALERNFPKTFSNLKHLPKVKKKQTHIDKDFKVTSDFDRRK
jgi:hypothetical protein